MSTARIKDRQRSAPHRVRAVRAECDGVLAQLKTTLDAIEDPARVESYTLGLQVLLAEANADLRAQKDH